MRELIADLFITLDGYAKGERSPAFFGYHGPDLQRWIDDETAKPQLAVMGRVTYETLQEYDDGESELSRMPKLLVSSTLTEAGWGVRKIVDSDEELVALKDHDGPPLRTIGSVSLVQSLLRRGAVDRLRLLVFPLVLGDTGAEPAFANLPDLDLTLADTQLLDGRLVLLEYRQ
jgi:dihydrofolate reductase